jgi:hypothetical protein
VTHLHPEPLSSRMMKLNCTTSQLSLQGIVLHESTGHLYLTLSFRHYMTYSWQQVWIRSVGGSGRHASADITVPTFTKKIHRVLLGQQNVKRKSKATPVTGCGDLQCCEMLRIPHCLDNQLTDGGKVASPTHRPCYTLQKHYYSASGTHFCQRLSKPQGLVRSSDL